tara:strand:+ start:973 stop:1425 length:453 start_codon:yes stop_codon:yes gene_type:complete
MSSAHKQIFIQNLVLQSQVINGLTEGVAVGQDLYDANGNKLDSVQLTGSASYAYTKTITLLPKFNDYILTAVCTGCSVTATLEFSPDGVTWCDCNLSDGNPCTMNCDPTTSDCTVKIVDVPLLQYVRVKISNAANTTLNCDIFLSHTMNY